MLIPPWTRIGLLVLLTTLIGWVGCDKGEQADAPAPAESDKSATEPKPPAPAPTPEGWSVLEPPGLGFRVAMPAAPQSRKDQHKTSQGTVDTTVWMAVTPAGAAYSIGVAEMPAAMADVLTPKAEFDDIRTKLQVKVGGKLVAEKNDALFGHPGRSFSLLGQGPKGESLIRVRLVRVGHRTFQLMTVHAKQEDMNADANAFFQSFSLSEK